MTLAIQLLGIPEVKSGGEAVHLLQNYKDCFAIDKRRAGCSPTPNFRKNKTVSKIVLTCHIS